MQVSVIFDSRICSTVMRHIVVLSACSNTLGPSASRAGYDWACIFVFFFFFGGGGGGKRPVLRYNDDLGTVHEIQFYFPKSTPRA